MSTPPNTKPCPFCAEPILVAAIRCKHCQADLTPETKGATASKPPSGAVGVLLLLVPSASAILMFLWIGQMNLLQNPGSLLAGLGIGTIVISAVLVGVEASLVGAGGPKDLGKNGNRRSGPVAWALVTVLMWIFGFPGWLYQRSKYGLPNMIVGGVLVTVLFGSSWAIVATAIETHRNSVASAFSSSQSEADERRERLQAALEQMREANAAPDVVTRAEFEQITEGMTYAQVQAIIGEPGEEQSSSEFAGLKMVSYSWKNRGGSNLIAMFQNGKLTTKGQFGLQ